MQTNTVSATQIKEGNWMHYCHNKNWFKSIAHISYEKNEKTGTYSNDHYKPIWHYAAWGKSERRLHNGKIWQ